MKSFKLTHSNPVKYFTFLTKKSFMKINRISFEPTIGSYQKMEMNDIISNFNVKVQLRHIVYEDTNITDDRIESFPIYLSSSPDSIHPIFEINKLIKTKTLTVGVFKNPKELFYEELAISLICKLEADTKFSVTFFYEEFKISEIL